MLGITKNLADGTATLAEGKVELCRCNRSGLLILRIDQFEGLDETNLGKSLRPLHISYTAKNATCATPLDDGLQILARTAGNSPPRALAVPMPRTDQEGSSDSEEAKITFVAARRKIRQKGKSKGEFENIFDREKNYFKSIETYTLGLENFDAPA